MDYCEPFNHHCDYELFIMWGCGDWTYYVLCPLPSDPQGVCSSIPQSILPRFSWVCPLLSLPGVCAFLRLPRVWAFTSLPGMDALPRFPQGVCSPKIPDLPFLSGFALPCWFIYGALKSRNLARKCQVYVCEKICRACFFVFPLGCVWGRSWGKVRLWNQLLFCQ